MCDIVRSEGGSSDENVLTVTVRVKYRDGKPVAGELVKMEDDVAGDTYGGTSADGCLTIYEGTGTGCINHTLVLPNRPDVDAVDLGCNSMGRFERTFVVPGELDGS